MRTFPHRLGTAFAWLPVWGFALAWLADELVYLIARDMICQPINSGGKEFICGRDYSTPVYQAIHAGWQAFAASLFILACYRAMQGKLTKTGRIGVIVSACSLGALFILRMFYGPDDSP